MPYCVRNFVRTVRLPIHAVHGLVTRLTCVFLTIATTVKPHRQAAFGFSARRSFLPGKNSIRAHHGRALNFRWPHAGALRNVA